MLRDKFVANLFFRPVFGIVALHVCPSLLVDCPSLRVDCPSLLKYCPSLIVDCSHIYSFIVVFIIYKLEIHVRNNPSPVSGWRVVISFPKYPRERFENVNICIPPTFQETVASHLVMATLYQFNSNIFSGLSKQYSTCKNITIQGANLGQHLVPYHGKQGESNLALSLE